MFNNEENNFNSNITYKHVGFNQISCVKLSDSSKETNSIINQISQKLILLLDNYTNKIKQLEVYKALLKVITK